MNQIFLFQIIYFFIFFIIFIIIYDSIKQEGYTNNPEVILVIARYNETLDWLKEDPFYKYHYIVYNKGVNSDYYKSDKYINEVQLPNVGRETHSYLTHIINNYNNYPSNFTFFLPGSIELENRYERSKRLINELKNSPNTDLFACCLCDTTSYEVNKTFTIDNYLSSNEKNKKINIDTSMKLSEIRPFGKWYDTTFGEVNKHSKCFTQNSMFGITTKTILKKPKSYYEDLIKQVNKHHNHETIHYFERVWETVFYPYTNLKHVT